MRPERDDTETRGLRGLGKGDVRWVVEVVLGEHLPKRSIVHRFCKAHGSSFGFRLAVHRDVIALQIRF